MALGDRLGPYEVVGSLGAGRNWSRNRLWPIGWHRDRCRLTTALAVARQIADALEAAHDVGIVHRPWVEN